MFSCSENACENINCGEHGTCNEVSESCDCDQYYEGEFCGEEIRSKYISNWSGTAICDSNPGSTFNLDVTITAGIDVNMVKIQSSEILQEFTMTGMLDESNDIIIPEFEAHVGSNTYDGKIVCNPDNNTLTVILNAYVGNDISSCVYNLSK